MAPAVEAKRYDRNSDEEHNDSKHNDSSKNDRDHGKSDDQDSQGNSGHDEDDEDTEGGDKHQHKNKGNVKVQICHFPPDDPYNVHTIIISQNALANRYSHGDLAGACDDPGTGFCDDDLCTVDKAVDGVCVSTPMTCDDGNLCTDDSCDAGLCLNSEKICDDNDACTFDSCNPSSGQCDPAPLVCDNGFTCDITDGCVAADVNECAIGTDSCDANAACTDTPGSFTCTCNPGYSGDGVNCN